jgi:BTB/POZ domain
MLPISPMLISPCHQDIYVLMALPRQRSDLWYADGTIILDNGSVQFRVYRGILAANSSVFNDMFSIPQPSGEDDLIEGCEVVQLHDSAVDLGHFLRATHETGYVITYINCYM